MMSKRIALTIGNYAYQDKNLSQFKTPSVNVQQVAAVLADPSVGNFDTVETLINQPAHKISPHIRDFFEWKKRYDLLVLYFSGHLILDQTRRLYLATMSTRLDALEDTAIAASYITHWMDRSFSRQQILVLDCYVARIAAPGEGNLLGSKAGTTVAFQGRNYGRVVLTATDTIQYVLEDQLVGEVADSSFGQYFIQGLRTGSADTDQDGQIGIEELNEYIQAQLTREGVQPQPRLWSYGKRDPLIIARNPSKVEPGHSLKWDLIFGAIMAPLSIIVIGGLSSLSTSMGMAGLFLLLYAGLYWVLD